jgi:putative transcriptional regulator
MIKHHPKQALLQGFASGELAASLSAAIAIHADMCPYCTDKIAQMMIVQAAQSFEVPHFSELIIDDKMTASGPSSIDLDAMISDIVADETLLSKPVRREQTITVGGKGFVLPQAIENMALGNFIQLGKLSRARLALDEGEIHSSLLHIQPGGSVPEHTHNGYELTLLLDGEFSDELGDYVPGDFILLDKAHTHQPKSEIGCLCLTVVDEPLHFTQGLNRLLNPIGSFIY